MFQRSNNKGIANNAVPNKSMDVRAKQRLSYQCSFFNSELCVFGFAPRHLNRWAAFEAYDNLDYGLSYEVIFMSVTTIEAIVENGQIRLPSSVRLPEKAKVYVLIPDIKLPTVSYIGSPRLVHQEQAVDFQKEVVEESSDASL